MLSWAESFNIVQAADDHEFLCSQEEQVVIILFFSFPFLSFFRGGIILNYSASTVQELTTFLLGSYYSLYGSALPIVCPDNAMAMYHTIPSSCVVFKL
jgi:hypothetical protein